MANVTTGNPWIADSTGALTTAWVSVRAIRWIGATTNAHTAVLSNAAGVVVWASQAVTSSLGTPEESFAAFSCTGLTVTTLASGKLYIYS